MTTTSRPDFPAPIAAHPRLPATVYVLGSIAFVLTTSEFMVAGMLQGMAADLGVSVATAGLMVTVFAVGIVVGSPAMAIATVRLPPQRTLVLALLLFALAHLLAATCTSFALLLVARLLSALATGVFWSVGAVMATASVGPELATRAMSVMTAGLTLATAFGIPLGSAAGLVLGWRGPFWILAGVALAAAILLARGDGRTTPPSTSLSVREQFSSLRSRQLWVVYTATVLVAGSTLAAYGFISPYLTDRIGLDASLIPAVLVGFGLGALCGTLAAGRFGGRHPWGTVGASAMVLVVVLSAMAIVETPSLVIVLVVLLGAAGFAPNAVLVSQTILLAGPGSTLAVAVSTSSFNTGIALGTSVASVALATPVGLAGPSVVGCSMALAALIPLAILGSGRASTDK